MKTESMMMTSDQNTIKRDEEHKISVEPNPENKVQIKNDLDDLKMDEEKLKTPMIEKPKKKELKNSERSKTEENVDQVLINIMNRKIGINQRYRY